MKEEKEELQDALDKLESCCPKNLSDSIKKSLTSDLRKALLNLDHARGREQRLKEESDALLEGMNIIIRSEGTRDAFKAVLEVLKRLLNFDDAFVLREQSNGSLSSVASTSPLFEDLLWQPGVMLKSVLAGHSVNLPDISISTDWQAQPPGIRCNVASALHTPFNTTTARAMLVCTSSRPDFFKRSCIRLLERFSPLAGQALYNLEINDLLRDEIKERKQAEKSLEAALTDLQNAKEELVTANDALREAHDDLELRVEQRTAELQASNVLLQSEIIERRRAEEEKEVLLREIHHRVKNNLQIISSILQLQAENVSDESSLATLRESRNRISAMSLIHEKLYHSKSLAKIDFQEYIYELITSLFISYGVNSDMIRSEIHAEGIHLDINTAIPCGLLLNELISNCLKHAFPEGRSGKIIIALHSDNEGTFTLMVSDDGIGFPETLDFRSTGTLGLQLVSALTNQLDANMELDRARGTAFRIAFRELKYKQRI